MSSSPEGDRPEIDGGPLSDRAPVPEHDRHRRVGATDEWASEYAPLLINCYGHFASAGDWPRLETLQRECALAGDRFDVEDAVRRMPKQLASVEDERLVLRARALRYVPSARTLLDDWYKVLRLAYALWRKDSGARLTRADVVSELDDDSERARRTSRLLLHETWPFSSGDGGPDDDWFRQLDSRVQIVARAASADELIDACDAIEFPPLQPPARTADEEPGRRLLSRSWELVSNNQLIAGLAVAILVAVGGWAIKSLAERDAPDQRGLPASTPVAGPSAPPTKPSTGRGGEYREQAGSGGARAFADPRALSGEGPRVKPGQYVVVTCKLYSPEPPSVVPDGYWYRLASPPWNGGAYAPANSFWNGDVPGKKPYTHNTDRSVPDC